MSQVHSWASFVVETVISPYYRWPEGVDFLRGRLDRYRSKWILFVLFHLQPVSFNIYIFGNCTCRLCCVFKRFWTNRFAQTINKAVLKLPLIKLILKGGFEADEKVKHSRSKHLFLLFSHPYIIYSSKILLIWSENPRLPVSSQECYTTLLGIEPPHCQSNSYISITLKITCTA